MYVHRQLMHNIQTQTFAWRYVAGSRSKLTLSDIVEQTLVYGYMMDLEAIVERGLARKRSLTLG